MGEDRKMSFHCKTCGANLRSGTCRKCDRKPGIFKAGDKVKVSEEGSKYYSFNRDTVLTVQKLDFCDGYPFVVFDSCPICSSRFGCGGHYTDCNPGYRQHFVKPENFELVT